MASGRRGAASRRAVWAMAGGERYTKSGRRRLLSLGEAAAALGVSTRTLGEWTDMGIVNATRRPISRRREFAPEEVERVRREVLGLERNGEQAPRRE